MVFVFDKKDASGVVVKKQRGALANG